MWVSILMAFAFLSAFIIGVISIAEATISYTRTESILSALALTDQAIDAVSNEGRNVLFTRDSEIETLLQARQVSFRHLEELEKAVAGDPVQEQNAGNLRRALLQRISTQDDQIRLSHSAAGEVRIDGRFGQLAAKSIRDVDIHVAAMRHHELGLLIEKDLNRADLQWNVVYAMIAFMTGGTALTIFLFTHLLSELEYRREIAEQLRHNTHMSADGDTVFGQLEVDEMIRIIEKADSA